MENVKFNLSRASGMLPDKCVGLDQLNMILFSHTNIKDTLNKDKINFSDNYNKQKKVKPFESIKQTVPSFIHRCITASLEY